jgi:hypothetical protein
MKIVGIVVVAVGAVLGLIALNQDTTVSVSHDDNGFTRTERVRNIGLMDDRRNLLIVSGFAVIAGILLFGFGKLANNRPEVLQQKLLTEQQKLAAMLAEQEKRQEAAAAQAAAVEAFVARTARTGGSLTSRGLNNALLPTARALTSTPARFDAGLKRLFGSRFIILYRLAQVVIYIAIPVAIIVAIGLYYT